MCNGRMSDEFELVKRLTIRFAIKKPAHHCGGPVFYLHFGWFRRFVSS